MSPSRRRLLLSGGTATAALAASAGCLGIFGGGSDGSDGTDSDGDGATTPATATTTGSEGTGTTTTADGSAGTDVSPVGRRDGPLAYRRWFPAPGDLGVDHYEGSIVRVADFRRNRDQLRDGVYEGLVGGPGPAAFLDLDPDLVDRSIGVGGPGGRVLEGRFPAGPLVDRLRGAGHEKRGEHRELEVFAGGSGPPAVAVTDGTVVLAARGDGSGSGPTGPERVRLLVDAAVGETLRYHQARPDFEALTERLGRQSLGAVTTSDRVPASAAGGARFAGQVGRAIGFTVDGATTYLTMLFLFGDADRADPASVREWAESAGGTLDRYENRSVAAEGRIVEFTADVPTDRAGFGVAGGGNGTRVPETAWSFEYDGDASTVTVTLTDGDPVEASSLTVLIDGTPTERQFVAEYDRVTPGDGLTVDASDASSGATVRVVWAGGDQRVTLALFDVP